jgi:GDPmannose 4,6-dehydratase
LEKIDEVEKFLINNDIDTFVNFGGPSSVRWCTNNPSEAWQQSLYPVLNLLKVISSQKKFEELHFVQALSSEMYGGSAIEEIDENSILSPKSEYGFAKSAIFELLHQSRSYSQFPITNLIMFNHESEIRSTEYISKKLISELVKVRLKIVKNIKVGNLSLKRDWSYADDFMVATTSIICNQIIGDFVLSSGKLHSIYDLANCAHKYLKIDTPLSEILIPDNRYFRQREPNTIFGNSEKARSVLQWNPKYNFEQIVHKMVDKSLEEQTQFI